MFRRPPRSTRTDTRFPYPTPCRALPTLLDGERTDSEIGNVPPRTPASAELSIQPHPLARGQDIGVALMAITQDHAVGRLVRAFICHERVIGRSEEHTSELQSLMRISYAVFCLKKKKKTITKH